VSLGGGEHETRQFLRFIKKFTRKIDNALTCPHSGALGLLSSYRSPAYCSRVIEHHVSRVIKI
jgi:hypothetical protein